MPMKFYLQNIGMVAQAEIEIDGLTVIAGENDTGKSTLAKTLYSIIRGLARSEEEFEQDREELLAACIDKLYFALRGEIDFEEHAHIANTLRNSFHQDLQELLHAPDEEKDRLVAQWKQELTALPLSEKLVGVVDKEFGEILKLLKVTSDNEQILINALNNVFSSEFTFELANTYSGKDSTVTGKDGTNTIFHLQLSGNEVTKLEVFDTLSFNEAIYIETPLVLDNPPVSRMGTSLSRRRGTEPLHVCDLLERLYGGSGHQAPDVFGKYEENIEKFNRMITKVIGGTLAYQSAKRQFTYHKRMADQGQMEFELKNVASGIKSFGLLQLLLKSGFFHHRSLLIIDEPEVHLHPTWQVEYARILVQLSKYFEANILLNSHSPYFIEAVKVFSDKEGIQAQTNFYLASKSKDGFTSTIENVTDSLEVIFEKLSEPFQWLEEETLGDQHD